MYMYSVIKLLSQRWWIPIWWLQL